MDFLQKIKHEIFQNAENERGDFTYGNRAGSPSSPSRKGGESSVFFPSRAVSTSSKIKILLVIDAPETDWVKIFQGKKLHNGDLELQVEQAEFSDLNLASYSDSGTVVDMQVKRDGNIVVRSFRPDFVLIRQHVKGLGPCEDFKNILLGLKYGNVPSINSLDSIYNFLDKPWVFAELVKIQKKLGKDQFPLIEQAFYPNHKEMLLTARFPVVVKVGHANSGYGKVCVHNHRSFQDVASIVAVSNQYATTEPFVEGLYDIRIQKIGEHYRVLKRTSLSDNWKTNTGSAVVEELPITDRYKLWADECGKLFGGLDMLCVEVIMTKRGKEYIVEVNDTGMKLFAEKQAEDQERLAELVIQRMQALYPPPPGSAINSPTKTALSGSTSSINSNTSHISSVSQK